MTVMHQLYMYPLLLLRKLHFLSAVSISLCCLWIIGCYKTEHTEQMSYWKLSGIIYSNIYLASLSLMSVFNLLSLPWQISRSLQNYKIPLGFGMISIAKNSLTGIKEEKKIIWKLRSVTLTCCIVVFQNIPALLPVVTDQPMDQWVLWCYVPSFLS